MGNRPTNFRYLFTRQVYNLLVTKKKIDDENTFHKGLLVGSDSRKNLSMVLLVSPKQTNMLFQIAYEGDF